MFENIPNANLLQRIRAAAEEMVNTLIFISMKNDELSCDKMAFYSRHFENVEFCLNRARTTLAILIFRESLHLFMTNKGIWTTREPTTRGFGSAKRDVIHPRAAVVYNTFYHLFRKHFCTPMHMRRERDGNSNNKSAIYVMRWQW